MHMLCCCVSLLPAGMVAAWEEAKAKADREAEWRAEWIRKQMQEADRKEQQEGREGGAQ